MDSCNLYRILSGKLRYKYLEIRSPTLDDILDANDFAESQYEQAFEQGVYTIDEMIEILIEKNLLVSNYKETQKELIRRLDKFKVDYFDSFFKSTKTAFFNCVGSALDELSRFVISYKQYEQYCCEGIRESSKQLFLLDRTVFLPNEQAYEWDKVSRQQLLTWIQGNRLGEADLREIAKSREWRSIWSCQGQQSFNTSSILSEEQRDLVYWTKLYDSVVESGESPNEDIMDDDWALDGWLIKQRQERKANISQKESKGQETFIMPSENRSVSDIYSMNPDGGKKIIKQLESMK